MSLLLALAAASAPVPPAAKPAGNTARARATIRIVSGQSVRFKELERDDPNSLRLTLVRGSDGRLESAKVLDFE